MPIRTSDVRTNEGRVGTSRERRREALREGEFRRVRDDGSFQNPWKPGQPPDEERAETRSHRFVSKL